MERATRLRRYSRKDYTQLVDFPVEIVGRDGQVRRYSYDESVRLYQRRIRSAPIRYDDAELIAAESRHCRQRIEQLRRSYVERHGWGALRAGLLPGILATPLAAEVVSFLRRILPGDRDAASSVAVVATGAGDVCWVRVDEGREFFVYLYRLDEGGPPEARDAWRAQMRQLAQAPAGEGVERLFVVQEGPDLGILFSGTGEWDGPALGPGDMPGESPLVVDDGDYQTMGLRALHEGAVAEAVRLFEMGMEAAPLRRSLAQSAALVALLDNQIERAEYAARFGRVTHPGDPLLAYLLGAALARGGRVEEAEEAVLPTGPALRTDPHLMLLRGLLALRRGRFLRGGIDLWRAGSGTLINPVERARSWVLALLPGLVLFAGTAAFALAGWLGAGGPALTGGWAVLVGLGVVAAGGAGLTLAGLRRRAHRVLSANGPSEVRLASLDLLPRDRNPDQDN